MEQKLKKPQILRVSTPPLVVLSRVSGALELCSAIWNLGAMLIALLNSAGASSLEAHRRSWDVAMERGQMGLWQLCVAAIVLCAADLVVRGRRQEKPPRTRRNAEEITDSETDNSEPPRDSAAPAVVEPGPATALPCPACGLRMRVPAGASAVRCPRCREKIATRDLTRATGSAR